VTDQAKAPVMGDVARLAGVSHMTVSRVINGHPNIRPETRDRVQRAILQLGYRPNTAARALALGRSGMVGIMTAAGDLFGPVSTHRAVEEAARLAGYVATSVTLSEMTHDAFDAAAEHLTRIGVEGIVVIAGHDAALDIAHTHRSSLPVVVVEGDLSRAALTVGVDQAAGARAATEHLLALGHRAIVHVSGPNDWAEARARVEGWRNAMAGVAQRTEQLVGDWSAASGYAAGVAIAERRDVSAVFAANDQMALGVLRALHERGWRVPEDISVVGFDDVPEAAYLIPPLTTVRQDFAGVGRRAIEVVTAAIQGEPSSPSPLLAPTLIVRDSTGPISTQDKS
jgi:DNA-binding LacI/PurR family transcriptional regulator